ncbi:MAG: replicative DNA helicase [Nitrospinae bacterium RIFCSPLOWO2_02_FULL_39_110]|nr:MAG: replicative DNA helicase [Nitrospinae bacterium RIFCSPHIGHO2_02_39_11]OGV98796.1 MAG: replicative DNA helicase [Nitrospinae bacterium RIFCSPHIGHO2_12_FULL_39_42]OGV99893.1 MAG: replicative DNA helicase [Nitrospinae bacterium RIFCSPHIGHO2_02_FULL_39_82]OGW04156.1 MAG: replicative DNA helicase [Nitrospinae bacterium RIFCSPLOWO2_02_FULL_39_110]OGW06474.1 MAG: replicative DNA helicase [Nitrospinae bacterium RIFCSPLOWO2_02_39_17]OGW09169.1 MAG: replicative DNA helicase [Nitrospinae bacteriu
MAKPDTSLIRLPPQNTEAERSILGAILLENEALPKSLEILRDESCFYMDSHRKIFAAIIHLFEKNQPMDIMTLSEILKKKNQLEEVGGVDYLVSLVESIPTAANIQYHSRIVKEKAILRNLISASTDIQNRCYEDSEDVDELLDHAEKSIFEISENKITPGFININKVVKESFDTIEKLFERKELVTGVPTGFKDFDQKTAGLHPSELIIVAGRPSMGKTAFCLNIANYVGAIKNKIVAIFSLEMSREQLVIRMLCSEARINASKVRTGYLSKSDWPDLTRAAGILSESTIFIDDTPAQSVLDIRAKSRRLQAEKKGLDLIIIDYLQLMRTRGKSENRQQEISEITGSLKALSKELKVPVIAVSQLSRAPEQRSDRRPQLSDLRESGAIEQDADLVVFIYREEFYKETPENQGVSDIIIGKQRNGPAGVTVKLSFFKEYTRFDNLARMGEDYGEVA